MRDWRGSLGGDGAVLRLRLHFDLLERRRSYRSAGVMLEIPVLAKLLVQDVEDLLMLKPDVDHLAGLLGANKILLADDAPVLLHKGELHQTQPVDVMPGAVMLQEPLSVLGDLTNEKESIMTIDQ